MIDLGFDLRKNRKARNWLDAVVATAVVILVPLLCLRRYDLLPAVAGVGLGALYCSNSKLRRRSYPVVVVGCVLAGLAMPLVPWPNEHKFALVFVCTGLAMALQGIWEIIRFAVWGKQPETVAESH